MPRPSPRRPQLAAEAAACHNSPLQGQDGAPATARWRPTDRACAVTEPLRSLLHAGHLLAPDDLAASVASQARMLGAREAVLYLADYEQAALLPLPGVGVPERQELPIEGAMAGRAFRRVEVVSGSAGRAVRMWLPLLDGVERLGVVELTLPSTPDEEHEKRLKAFMSLVAELVVAKDAYSDVFSRLRRRKTLSLDRKSVV